MHNIVLTERPSRQLSEQLRHHAASIANVHVVEPDRTDLKPMLEIADAILVRLFPVTEEVISQATRLKVVGRHGVGFDTVDVAAATRRRIPVVFTPQANSDAVAEHAMMLMLAVSRRLVEVDETVRSGGWREEPYPDGAELFDKTVGIVGFGKIGRRVAHLCGHGFGMRVVVYDPFVPAADFPDGIRPAETLKDLLREADCVTLHIPLTPENRHMINDEHLGYMKPGAILVNTARGGLVDHKALAHALDRGHLAGAGLDVYEEEPLRSDSLLLALDKRKVTFTPHSAALTDRSMKRMAEMVCNGIFSVLSGEQPTNVANPEVWEVC